MKSQQLGTMGFREGRRVGGSAYVPPALGLRCACSPACAAARVEQIGRARSNVMPNVRAVRPMYPNPRLRRVEQAS